MSIYGVMLGSGAENPTYAVSPNVSSVNEGSSVTWNITTTNVPNSTTLYWTNNGTTGAADFTGGVNSGSFTITNNVGSFSLTLVNDVTTEGSETIIIQIRTGSISGPVVATASTVTVNDTSLAPTYSVSPNTSTVNEGSGVTWTVTTANVSNGTVLYWTNGGTTVAGDFSENVNSGSVTINSNTGAFALNLVNDATTEGSETIVISIRTGSTSGPVVATAATVTVNDTSLTPTYSVSPTTTSVNEGSSVTFNVSTANVGNGTTLYWTNAGTTVAGDFSDSANSGSFTINTNSGSVTKTLNNDVTTEGSETIIFQVRTGSTGGPVVATAATVTVNDTSLSPTYSVSGSPNPQSEGGTITWSVSTTNVANGTTLYYTFSGSAGTSDYTSASSGSFTINTNAGSFTTTLANDFLTEGSETITAEIRTGSTGGPIVASGSVTISDTSLARGYSAIVYPGITNANTPRPEGPGATFPTNILVLTVNNAQPGDCFRFGIHTGNTANSDWQVRSLQWMNPTGGIACTCNVDPANPICNCSNMPYTFQWVPGAICVQLAALAVYDSLQPGPEGTEWTHFDMQATGGCNNSHQCIFTAANFPILDNCWYSTQPTGFNERILGGGAGGGGSTAQINPGPGGGGAGGWREVPAITFPTTACWGVTIGGGGGGGLNTGTGGAGGTTSALGFGTPAPGGGGGGASTGGIATAVAGGGGGGGGANCALGGLGPGGAATGGGGSGGAGRYANFSGSRGSMGGGGGGSLQAGQASWSTGTPVPAAGCGRGGNGGAGRLAYIVSGGNWQTDAGGGGGGGSGSDWTNHGSGGPGGGGDGWSGGGGNYAAAGGGGARGNGAGGVQGVGAIAHGGIVNTNRFSLNVAPSHHAWQHAPNCYMHQFDAPFCFTNNLYPDRLA